MTSDRAWENRCIAKDELTEDEWRQLSDAANGLVWKDSDPGASRYGHYRRQGYSREESLSYALAWCCNAIDQKRRRLGHETGAENSVDGPAGFVVR